MTPLLALQALKELHQPYLPELVGILDGGHPDEPLREPTLDEQAAALEWWCDACRLPAARCVQYPVILDALHALKDAGD